jgi:hypothetical protein
MKLAQAFMAVLALAIVGSYCSGQIPNDAKQIRTHENGDSFLKGRTISGDVRVAISTAAIDIGRAGQVPPNPRKTNCTYSRFPCSQVTHLSITVNGKQILVLRSAFADLADIGTMELSSVVGLSVLTLTGGDASEAYTAKLFFDNHRVRKREVFAKEAGALLEKTTYSTPTVLN